MSHEKLHPPESAQTPAGLPLNDPFLDHLQQLPNALLGEANAPNTDNSPTIISKNPPSSSNGKSGTSGSGVMRSDLRGRQLAHFELIEAIGVGGMAAVLRARDQQLDRNVALKILPPDMAAEPENVKRFHQEARAAAKLDHENIARVFFCGEDQGLHFIAFEFVEGDNLRTLLERRGRLAVAEAIHYMLQIATGLAHAAERGVVHRDIKPSNIIISPNGRAKLVDMGLARSQEPHSSQALTQSGVTLGTFDYISPEQALEPREADVRSDIYSLGCTFYHALTGQPPVPEGTAAKKLHCHQHVPPIDPRQLNPTIPDSMAAILARMMAKDVRARYQRPEQLVQHLLQVAQQLDCTTQLPEGLLYVDTPLPSPPQKRPGLLLGLATAGLIGLLVLLSFAPGSTGPDGPVVEPHQPRPLPPVSSKKRETERPPVKKDMANVPPRPVPLVSEKEFPPVSDEAQLKEALAAAPARIILARDIDIHRGELLFQGDAEQPTIIAPANPERHIELRIHYSPGAVPSASSAWAGLRLEEGHVQFHNVTIRLLAEPDGKAEPPAAVAGIAVGRTATVEFSKCILTQKQTGPVPSFLAEENMSGRRKPAATILLSNLVMPIDDIAWDPNTKPTLVLHECFFPGGQAAVAVEGAAKIDAVNCAFGPHNCIFHLHGRNMDESWQSSIALRQCSTFVVHGPVFRIDDDCRCQVQSEHCVFSQPERNWPALTRNGAEAVPEAPLPQGDKADLICQTGSSQLLVRYNDRDSIYHNLNGFLDFAYLTTTAPTPLIHKLDDFTSEVLKYQGSIQRSLVVEQSPWKSSQPLQDLRTASAREALRAFRLNPSMRDLWESVGSDWNPAGVEKCLGEFLYRTAADKPARPAPEAVARNSPKKIDPTGRGDYETITAAISEAKDNDTLLIYHNGILPVGQQQATLAGSPRTIFLKPAPGYQPVLVLPREFGEPEGSLFLIKHGTVHFHNLAFSLEADHKDALTRSIVTLSGQGSCQFTDCVLTLQPAPDFRFNHVQLYAVSILDGNKRMAAGTEELPAVPSVLVKDSVVRGQGRFLNLVQPIPFKLETDNALVALSGSLVQFQVNVPLPLLSKSIAEIKLTRTTTFLDAPLLQLADKKTGNSLLSTDVLASHCLFAAHNGKPLVHLEGVSSMEQLRQCLSWRGTHNAYCGYETVLEQQALDGGMGGTMKLSDQNWRSLFGEQLDNGDRKSASRFDKATLAVDILNSGTFADLTPGALRSALAELQEQMHSLSPGPETGDLDNYGAQLSQLQRLTFPTRTRQMPLILKEMMPPTELQE